MLHHPFHTEPFLNPSPRGLFPFHPLRWQQGERRLPASSERFRIARRDDKPCFATILRLSPTSVTTHVGARDMLFSS
jgi:hypothetical protein